MYGKPSIAFDIIVAATRVVMNVAISFDNHAAFETDEIGNEGADWVLTAEAMANDLPFAQDLPEGFFGLGLV